MPVRSSAFQMVRNGSTLDMNSHPRIDLTSGLTQLGSGTLTLNCQTQSTFYKAGGAGTFTLANMGDGQFVTVVVSSTGGAYAITWAYSGSPSATIRWSAGPSSPPTVPTPTITNSRFDLYSFLKIGSNIFATAALNFG